jgi:hypothetical protein
LTSKKGEVPLTIPSVHLFTIAVTMRLIPLLAWFPGLPAALAESWTVLASIPTGTLREHTTVALGSQVITLGGVVTGGATTKMVQVYDTTSNKWTRVADLPVPINHGNVAVVDGKIWLLGGLTSTSAAYTWKATTAAAVYDPATDAWTALEGLSTALARGASAVGAYNGTICMFAITGCLLLPRLRSVTRVASQSQSTLHHV